MYERPQKSELSKVFFFKPKDLNWNGACDRKLEIDLRKQLYPLSTTLLHKSIPKWKILVHSYLHMIILNGSHKTIQFIEQRLKKVTCFTQNVIKAGEKGATLRSIMFSSCSFVKMSSLSLLFFSLKVKHDFGFRT